MKRHFVWLPLLAAAITPLTHAHDGHGAPTTWHWHATDAWGFAMVAVCAAGVWFGRKK